MLQASQQNLVKLLGPIATLVVGPEQMSDVTLREGSEQKENAFSTETGAPADDSGMNRRNFALLLPNKSVWCAGSARP